MAKKKRMILPVILMVDDKSSAKKDAFVLALRQLKKEDIPDNADKKAVFQAGLLIDPGDYIPGFQLRKDKALTTRVLAEEVRALRDQLKNYENYLRKQKEKAVDLCTLMGFICGK